MTENKSTDSFHFLGMVLTLYWIGFFYCNLKKERRSGKRKGARCLNNSVAQEVLHQLPTIKQRGSLQFTFLLIVYVIYMCATRIGVGERGGGWRHSLCISGGPSF